jgi:hypothetical protein
MVPGKRDQELLSDGAAGAKRPLGVWLLATIYFAWAAFVLVRLGVEGLYPPNCHNCLTQWDAGVAPYTLLLHAWMLSCAVGTFRGRKLARLGLLLSATLLVVWSVFYEAFWYITRIAQVEKPQDLASPSFWLSTLWVPSLFAIWLGCTGWYLYGPAAKFFSGGERNAGGSIKATH